MRSIHRLRFSKFVFLVFCATLVAPCGALIAEAPAAPLSGSGLQSASILNPNLSVIGWFQGLAGNTPAPADDEAAFRLREAEIGFQAVVDPFSRADIFVSVDDAGKVDLEEGYLTALTLPYGFQAKLGKFQPDLGKFNRTHTPETPFADRPLAAREFFGEEPMKAIGGALSHTIPNPWDLYLNLDAEVTNTPSSADVPAFDGARRGDLLYLGRLSSFFDLAESLNLNLGFSCADGANGFAVSAVDGSSSTRRNQVLAADMVWRWKNPRRAIYRSLTWQTEFYWTKRELSPDPARKRGGLFSALDWQFSRRWHAGARWDWTQELNADDASRTGTLLYLAFMPSEFALVSLQGKQARFPDGALEHVGFLKITFNIGPHGAHPF